MGGRRDPSGIHLFQLVHIGQYITDLAGKLFVSSGLGGMSGAQGKAVEIANGVAIIAEVDHSRIKTRLDQGWIMKAVENPAEALVLLAESPYSYYIHINDNDGRWDWDYFCGTKHFLEYVEFIYYLKRYGYTGYFTSDTSPTRWDIKGTFEANSRMTNRIWQLLDEVDNGRLAKLIAGADYLETWKFIESNIFGLK